MQMATTTYIVALVFALIACYGTSSAPSPAPALAPETTLPPSPAAGSGCMTVLLNMSDCLTFVSDGSNLTKPDKGCCPELAGLVDSNPICLCELLGNQDSIGIKIDLRKSLKLPSICGVTTPPVSTCSVIGVPVSLPPGEDSTSPSSLPSEGPGPSSGSARSPSSYEAAASPAGDKNKGSSGIQASAVIFTFGLVTVFLSTLF